ncbi:hypothetical protein NDU88_008220 [Pleurodeles waltl]|uniref:Uncharacterized protein n=1 Tax=Pleurodeles waltl TaxID=8319 RepID=A0AAV7QR50_PLEWA|nr:hypothetical protein NDU88_008220 [Pleurodeles waltl]
MRNTPDRKTGLSPQEILMGRAMRLPAVPENALVNITDDMVLDYCKGLADVVRSFSQQVVLTTTTAVNCAGIPNWIHARHKKEVACPLHHEEELLRVPTAARQVSGPEREQGGTETGPEPVEDGSVTPVRDEGVNLQESDREPISIEAAGEPSQRRAFPEAEDLESQTLQLPDPEGKGNEVDQSHCDLTHPEPIAGPSRENTAEQG